MTRADPEWLGTRVAVALADSGAGTSVRFRRTGGATASDNYRGSTYCWAMYLRILKRYLEHAGRSPTQSASTPELRRDHGRQLGGSSRRVFAIILTLAGSPALCASVSSCVASCDSAVCRSCPLSFSARDSSL